MVPSYNGRLCMVAPLKGFFQSFVPVARPTKLSTVIGALSGKSVQLMSPAVVWKVARIGCFAGMACVPVADLGLAGLAVDFGLVVAVCAASEATTVVMKTAISILCMRPPEFFTSAAEAACFRWASMHR